MELVIQAVLIFVIFFLVCLFGQFLRFLENKRDKRKLYKLKSECPGIQTIVSGRVLSSQEVLHINCSFNGEKFMVTCLNSDFSYNVKLLTVYKKDGEYSFYKLKEAQEIHVEDFKVSQAIKTCVEVGAQEFVVETQEKYKKKSKIRLIKTLGNDVCEEFRENDCSGHVSDPEISALIEHESEILQYEDSFSPNIFIDVVISLGITLFILIGIALLFM